MHTQPPHTSNVPDFPLEQAVSPNEHGMRLDAFLALILPGLGVRARRRLWEWCRVCVNNKPRKPGFALQTGDVVRIAPQEHSTKPLPTSALQHGAEPAGGTPAPPAPQPAPCMAKAPHKTTCTQPFATDYALCPAPGNPALPCLLEANDGWYALYKPHGLHTAHVAGGNALSLEGMLPTLWPSLAPNTPPATTPRLVTRLDGPTAGLVLAVSDTTREQAFRQAEAQGKVQKTYAALLHGLPPAAWHATAALDTANRKITKLLATPSPHATRHTHCSPKGALDAAALLRSIVAAKAAQFTQAEHTCAPLFARMHALLACPAVHALWQEAANAALPASALPCISLAHIAIARGARHQIRTHMAGGGYPLLGDTLYSTPAHMQTEATLLHAWQQALHLFALALINATAQQGVAQEDVQAIQEVTRHAQTMPGLPLFLQYAAVQSPWLHTQCWPAWGRK